MKYLYLTFTLFTSIVFAQDCDKGLFNEFKQIDNSKDVNFNNEVIVDESGDLIRLYNLQKANFYDGTSGYNKKFDNGYIIHNPKEKLRFESNSMWIKNDLSIGHKSEFDDFYLPDFKCGDMKILLKDFFDLLTSLEGDFKCVADISEVSDNLITRNIKIWENGVIWEQSYEYDYYKDSGLLKRKIWFEDYYHSENQTPLLKIFYDPQKDLTKQKYFGQFLRFSDVLTIFNSKGCIALQLFGLNGKTGLQVSNPNETKKITNDPSFTSSLNTFLADRPGLPLRYEVIPNTPKENEIQQNTIKCLIKTI